jgi:MFS family permease
MGMGKYQYLIFFLCGLGYFLDLLWAVVFSLVAGPIQAEMGINEGDIGWLYASFNAGLMVGAMGWGMAVDVIGVS